MLFLVFSLTRHFSVSCFHRSILILIITATTIIIITTIISITTIYATFVLKRQHWSTNTGLSVIYQMVISIIHLCRWQSCCVMQISGIFCFHHQVGLVDLMRQTNLVCQLPVSHKLYGDLFDTYCLRRAGGGQQPSLS